MMINLDLIGFYLTYYFILQVLWKDNFLPNSIDSLADKLPVTLSEYVKDLAGCKFCMSWWVAVLSVTPIVIYFNEPYYFLWAVYVTAINAHMKK